MRSHINKNKFYLLARTWQLNVWLWYKKKQLLSLRQSIPPILRGGRGSARYTQWYRNTTGDAPAASESFGIVPFFFSRLGMKTLTNKRCPLTLPRTQSSELRFWTLLSFCALANVTLCVFWGSQINTHRIKYCYHLSYCSLSCRGFAHKDWRCTSLVCPCSHGGVRYACLERERERTNSRGCDRDLLNLDTGGWGGFHYPPLWYKPYLFSEEICLGVCATFHFWAHLSDSTMSSRGKYCVFLFLLKSILSDPGTSNQGE